VAEKSIDLRGLACPQPVVQTRKAILEDGVNCVKVVVDRDVSAENIQRMARSHGWETAVEQEGDEYQLTLTRGGKPAARAAAQPEPEPAATIGQPQVVVFVTSDVLGEGDPKLGHILMKAFVKTLKDVEQRPQKAIFANSGVRLTSDGSDLIDDLRALEEAGMEVLSCGTCLDYYGLKERLQVGSATNMYEIATSLIQADRIVQPR
jgi:selenium metabolism protein YedF